MPMPFEDDEGAEPCPIWLRPETRAWLNEVARSTGRHPLELAAIMLDDIRRDDEGEHRPPTLM